MLSLASTLLLATALVGADLESGKYAWMFKTDGQTQRMACEIEVAGDNFTIRSEGKDPLKGRIDKGNITFGISNDANFIKAAGTLDDQGLVTGDMSWGQGGVVLAKGTFLLAPVGTAEQRAAFEKRFKSERRKWELPEKKKSPAVVKQDPQELVDMLGKLQLAAPILGGTMKLEQYDASPVTRVFRFEFESGEVAVLVSTKMRDDRPKDDTAVVRQEQSLKLMQQQFGADVMQVAILGQTPDRMSEIVLLNAADTPQYPLALSLERSKTLNTVSVAQAFVKSDRYLECAIIVKNFNSEPEDEFVARAKEVVTQWREAIKVVK